MTRVKVRSLKATYRTTSSNKLNGIKFMGLIQGLEKNSYVLTLTDHYTKYLTVIPVIDHALETTVTALKYYCKAFISNRRRKLNSSNFTMFLKQQMEYVSGVTAP